MTEPLTIPEIASLLSHARGRYAQLQAVQGVRASNAQQAIQHVQAGLRAALGDMTAYETIMRNAGRLIGEAE